MTGFTEAMVPEIVQPFWAAVQRGEFITDAAGMAGTYLCATCHHAGRRTPS